MTPNNTRLADVLTTVALDYAGIVGSVGFDKNDIDNGFAHTHHNDKHAHRELPFGSQRCHVMYAGGSVTDDFHILLHSLPHIGE